MAKRPLKADEKRAWARVAKTVRARPGQQPPEMPPLEGLTPLERKSSVQPASKSGSSRNKTPRANAVFSPVGPGQAAQKSAKQKPITAPIQNRGKERRVRRGQAEISATLDLHGHTQETAQRLLVQFLSSQRRMGGTCVLVITGKGRRGEGVLRRRLLDWLGTSQARALISGYASAHRKHGGSGAWYLFLRKLPET